MVCNWKRLFCGGAFLLLLTVLGDTYPQKHIEKFTCWGNLCILAQRCSSFSGPGPIFGQKQTPEAAAGHNILVLRKKTLLASMAHEFTDRTSRRADIPPPEESTKGVRPPSAAAPLLWSGAKRHLLWWRNLSPPACPVRLVMRHAG